jgi:periplasmic copper chaperone A
MKSTILLATMLAIGATVAQAHDYTAGTITIAHPWSRATPSGASVGAGYLKLTNTGSAPDRLLGGSSPVAGKVEIHEMATTNGVMTMRPVADGLEIKPGQTVELKPGSFHIMLMGLKQPLKRGEKVKGTLQFEKGGSVDIEYDVEAIGGSPTMAMPDHGGAMQHGH